MIYATDASTAFAKPADVREPVARGLDASSMDPGSLRPRSLVRLPSGAGDQLE